jgi:hypothetical protein
MEAAPSHPTHPALTSSPKTQPSLPFHSFQSFQDSHPPVCAPAPTCARQVGCVDTMRMARSIVSRPVCTMASASWDEGILSEGARGGGGHRWVGDTGGGEGVIRGLERFVQAMGSGEGRSARVCMHLLWDKTNVWPCVAFVVGLPRFSLLMAGLPVTGCFLVARVAPPREGSGCVTIGDVCDELETELTSVEHPVGGVAGRNLSGGGEGGRWGDARVAGGHAWGGRELGGRMWAEGEGEQKRRLV